MAGDRFVDPALTPDRLPVTAESGGYDGQFVYRLALEPVDRPARPRTGSPWTTRRTGSSGSRPRVLAWAVGLLPGVSTLLALLLVNVAA